MIRNLDKYLDEIKKNEQHELEGLAERAKVFGLELRLFNTYDVAEIMLVVHKDNRDLYTWGFSDVGSAHHFLNGWDARNQVSWDQRML